MSLDKALSWAIKIGLFSLPLTPLLVSTSLFFPFITGKGFFFRVVTEIIFALWLILALRDPNYRPRRSWLLIAMSIFLLALVLATAWGTNPYRSFWSNFERMEGLVSYLHLFAYFLILTSMMKTSRQWQWLLHGSLAVNLIIGVYSLLQLAGKLVINQGGVRVDATFGNATYLAVYELFHIFLLALLIFRLLKSDRWRRAIYYKWLIGVYLGLLALDAVILFYTQTRGAILGVIGGVIIGSIWLMASSARGSRERRWSVVALMGTVALVTVFLLARQSDFVKQNQTLARFASISLEERTTQARFLIWNMSWQGFKERPILGWGPENYLAVFNKYYDPLMYNQEQWFDRAHNVIFDWLIAGGLLGLLAYLSLFVIALYHLWRVRSDQLSTVDRAVLVGLLAGYFFHNFFVFDNLVSYLLFFGLLAYLHTIFSKPWPEKSLAWWSRPISGKASAVSSAIIAVLFFISFYFVIIKPFKANTGLIEALSRQKYPAETYKRFERVFAYNTFGSAEATEQLINLSLQIANRQDVAAELKQSYARLAVERAEVEIKRMPLNARYPFFLGSFYFRFGQTDLGIERLEAARRLSPKKQAILFELGSAYFAKSELPKALAIWEEAYELAPNFGEARKIYALGAVYGNQLPLAADLLNAGAVNDPAFLLDERLVQAYGSINKPDALVAVWQKSLTAYPEFNQPLMDFLADLKKRGVIN